MSLSFYGAYEIRRWSPSRKVLFFRILGIRIACLIFLQQSSYLAKQIAFIQYDPSTQFLVSNTVNYIGIQLSHSTLLNHTHTS